MRKLNTAHILCTLLAVLLLTACQPIRPDQDMDAQAAQTETAEPATPTSEPPSPLFTLQEPTAGEALTAEEVFAAVSPAVAFVETPLNSGSAVLIEGNYLLTNAHVVWPYTEVHVVFPDRSEHPAAPVAGWDLIADLALVGPLDTQIEPLPLVDGGDLPVGSDVFLIGYPDEKRKFPQPTIATGIFARPLRWETIDYTFFQVDDPAEKEKFLQPTFTTGILSRLLRWETIDYTFIPAYDAVVKQLSGGPMLSQTGDVVGLSTFTLTGTGLAASIADALPRLNTILGHELGVTIESRGLPQGEGRREFERTLQDDGDRHYYLLRETVGTEVEISVEGVDSPEFYVLPFRGSSWQYSYLDDTDQKLAALSFDVSGREPWIVAVYKQSESEQSYLLTSSHPLLPFPDPDDGRILAVGDSYVGALDRIYDTDVFELKLNAGDRVQIDVDSIGFDPWTELLSQNDDSEIVARDDDSGGGLFGFNSRILYEAPEDGTYLLRVKDTYWENTGSYFVSVTVPTEAAEPIEPRLQKRSQQIPFGKLIFYSGDRFAVLTFEPKEWVDLPGEECEGFVLCYFWGPTAVLIMDKAFHELTPQERSREGFLKSLDSSILHEPGNKKLSAETVTAYSGLEMDRLEYSLDNRRMFATIIVYVDETQGAVFALLASTSPDTQHLIEGPEPNVYPDFPRCGNRIGRQEGGILCGRSAAAGVRKRI